MSTINPVGGIVSPTGPDVVITIELDTKTNKTTLKTNTILNRFSLISVLMQHALALNNQIIAESVNSKNIKGMV